MLDNRYDVKAASDLTAFEFDSVGPKGTIRKVVRYSEINLKGVFNLGFGDKDPVTGFISDLTITNNNDSKKVLATVAATLYFFTDFYPDVTIIATGSTEARPRLYIMGGFEQPRINSKRCCHTWADRGARMGIFSDRCNR
jgi:hypothetical protein